MPLVFPHTRTCRCTAATTWAGCPASRRSAGGPCARRTTADLTLVTSPPMKAEFEEHGIELAEVWNKGIDTAVFHPQVRRQAVVPRGAQDRRARRGQGRRRRRRRRDARRGRRGRARDARAPAGGQPRRAARHLRRAARRGEAAARPQGHARAPARRAARARRRRPDRAALEAHFEGTSTVLRRPNRAARSAARSRRPAPRAMHASAETLGFVVLEAMASGVPVVGCDAGRRAEPHADGETGCACRRHGRARREGRRAHAKTDRAAPESVRRLLRLRPRSPPGRPRPRTSSTSTRWPSRTTASGPRPPSSAFRLLMVSFLFDDDTRRFSSS